MLPILAIGSCKAKEKPAGNNTLLWKITGSNSSKPSYLFGTIHLLCPDDYLWTDVMKSSLKNTEKVCFEMDMDDPEVLSAASSGMIAKDNKNLEAYFTTEQYGKLGVFVKKELGMDVNMLQQMSPVMLQMLLSTKAVSCAIPVSYEANIMEEAKKQGKEIIGLEDPSEQIAVLNKLPEDSAVAQIMELADNFEVSKTEYQAMLTAYKNQDIATLYKQIQGSKELGSDLGIFLDDRNEKWIPRMTEKMKNNTIFFAVGAGHLWGDQGVITLLRKAGYRVEPVK